MSRALVFLTCIISTLSVFSQTSLPRISLDTTNETIGLDVLSDYLNNKKVVLFGENHRYSSSNQLLKLKSIQYLYDKGFRYVTMEFGAGIGYLANEYVQTGDKDLLTILNGGFDEEEKNHIHELLLGIERINKGKDKKNKIKVTGVDYTRYPVYSLKSLAYMLEEKNCQQEFYTFYEDLEVISSVNLDDDNIGFASRLEPSSENFDIRYGFKSYKNRLFELSIRNLVADFYEDSTVFKNRLGEYYDQFSYIIEELKSTLDWYLGTGVDIQMHIERERHLTKGMKAILEKDSSAKITGQFGRCHTRAMGIDGDCYSFSMSSMAKRLENDEALTNKIAVVPIYYKNEGEFSFNKKNTDKKFNELLPGPGIYVYNLKDSIFTFDKVTADSSYVLINTYWNGSLVSEIIERSDRLSQGNKTKRKESGENLIVMGAFYNYLPNEINQDFGVSIFPQDQIGIGIEYTSIEEDGMQNSFALDFTLPNKIQNDSVELNYTNWSLQSSVGYNIIYRKSFDFFTNYHLALGFAKIVERRGFSETIYTYSTNELKNVYRNPYFNIAGELGFRLKFGWFGIQVKGGYQYDFTNPKWRNKTILPHSTGINFRNFYGQAGLLIRW
jgi:hypothetical protein